MAASTLVALERGMTAASLAEYLESKERLRSLADIGMRDEVDGDTIIGAVQADGTTNPAVLAPLFHEGAATGALSRLAQEILKFIKVEAEVVKLAKAAKTTERSAEKKAALIAAIEKEKQATVSSDTMKLGFVAAKATASADEPARAQERKKRFEKDGHAFPVNISEPVQPHLQFFLDNKAACLQLLDGVDEESGEIVPAKFLLEDKALKKPKKGGPPKLTHIFKIHVSGAFLKRVFSERVANNQPLRLFEMEGPYSMPFFISLISKASKDAKKGDTTRCAKSTPEQLEAERDAELERLSTKGAKEIASAEITVLARLREVEKVGRDASAEQRTAREAAVEQARRIKNNTEDLYEREHTAVEQKWAERIAIATAAAAKVDSLKKSAKEKEDAAKKRKCDAQDQAAKAMQSDVLRNAAKRARQDPMPAQAVRCSNLSSSAYAAAAYGAWLRTQPGPSAEPAETTTAEQTVRAQRAALAEDM